MKKNILLFVCISAVAFYGCGKEDVDTPAFNACSNTKNILLLPFEYTLTENDRILAPGYLDSSNDTYVHFSPFGAHFNPMTDNVYGNNKINFVGFFSENNGDIVELPAGSGVFGYSPVTGASEFNDRRPMYYAPAYTRITSISYDGPTSGDYLNDEPIWSMTLDFGSIEMKLEHVGKMSPALHDFIAHVPSGSNDVNDFGLGIDTDTYTGPLGDIFPAGYLITAQFNTELAFPPVHATAVPGWPGYYNAPNSSYPDRPHVQMEFVVSAPTSSGTNDVCAFELMSTSLQNDFQNILSNDLTNPDSQLYEWSVWQDTAWLWRAESSVCLSCSTSSDGLNGLYKDLGGWFDRGDNGTIKNELVAFVPVEQDNATVWNPILYKHDAQTEWLMLRRRNNSQSWDWTIDGNVVSTDYPAGEIITVEQDALLVLWRDLGQVADADAYQWVRYDVTGGVVTLKFGDFESDITNVLKPDFDLSIDIANEDDVVTFDKTPLAGF
ncbi:MAG: hypothetical protein OSB63_06315 [Planctomycetota bacterium]|nr:hypothetical protein [Planctomycetota bacterium]